MRPGMRWLGGSRLQINTRGGPSQVIPGVRLMFVPVTPHTGWVSWDADRYAVVYPCAGALADTGRARVPEPLRALLGPARAGVLVLLGAPKSTTQLVALTGQGLGSVGRHLKVLLDAGLIHAAARGPVGAVLPYGGGEALVRAGDPEDGPVQGGGARPGV